MNTRAKNAPPSKKVFRRVYTAGKMVIAVLTKNPFKIIIHIGITLAFVYIVNRNISISDVVSLLGNIDLLQFLAAFVLGAISFFFQLLRWRLILASHRLPSKMIVAAKTMFRGFLFAFLTPGRLGELFRAMDLDKNRKMDTVLAVVEERFCAMLITVIGGILCIIAHIMFYPVGLFIPLIVAALLFCVIFIGLIFIIARGDTLPLKKFSLLNRMAWLLPCFQRWKNLPIPSLLIYSLSGYLLLLLQTSLLFNMFGNIDFIQGILLSGQAYAFMLFFPFFIANIGLREYSFSFFLAKNTKNILPVAASTTVSFSVATLILLFNIIVPAAIGIVWMYAQKQPKKNGAVTPFNSQECKGNDYRNINQ